MAVLTKRNIQEFKDKGFTQVDQFWSHNELSTIRLALKDLQQQGKLNNVATEGDGVTPSKASSNLQLCPLIPEHKVFACLPWIDKVGQAVAALVQEEEQDDVTCYLSQTFWKPALQGLGTSWHQDNAYFGLSDGRRGTAMWTAVHDANLDNGTLHLVANKDKQVLPHERDLASDHHISCSASIEESDGEPAIVPAGGVVFFNCNVPHCTKANKSAHPRAAVAYHFVASEVAPKTRQFSLPDGANYTEVPVIAGKGRNLAMTLAREAEWHNMVQFHDKNGKY